MSRNGEKRDVDIFNEGLPADGQKNWQWKIQIDDDGWWLYDCDRCRTSKPWKPGSASEAYAVVVLLHMLNEYGPAPIPEALRPFMEQHNRTEADVQGTFQNLAFSIYVRYLIR